MPEPGLSGTSFDFQNPYLPTPLSFGAIPTTAGALQSWQGLPANTFSTSMPSVGASAATQIVKSNPETEWNSSGFLGLFDKNGNGDTRLNYGNLGSLAKTLEGFGQLYNAFQLSKLAKDTFNFQKQSYAENMANQISAYNLALTDRVNARYAQNNQSSAAAQDYINQHKLGQ